MICSIIIPVYNAEKTLERCVTSILSQEDVALELILVDDGSTDSSATLCDQLAKLDARISVIHKSNGGVSSARNAGLAKAQGQYVYFADSDDLVMPNALNEMSRLMQTSDVDLVIADYITKNSIKGETKIIKSNLPHGILLAREYITTNILHDIYRDRTTGIANLWNKLFKSEIINRYQISFDEKRTHGEDWAFIIDYLMHCNNCIAISKCVYEYHIDGSQTYLKYKKGLMYSFINGFEKKLDLSNLDYFTPTKEETDSLYLRYVDQIFFLIEISNKDDINYILSNYYTKSALIHAIKIPNSSLRKCGYTKRFKLSIVLLRLNLIKLAIKQYHKCK